MRNISYKLKMAKICSPNQKFKKNPVIKTKSKKNNLKANNTKLATAAKRQSDLLVTDNTTIEQALPVFQGALDTFIAPNIFRGWVFYQEGFNLRIRIVAGSTIFGETNVDTFRPDLTHLNNGLTGWLLESQYPLSEQEFIAIYETIQVLVLDDANQVIGSIPIWGKLLEKLARD